mgnify:CR=1 FL=1
MQQNMKNLNWCMTMFIVFIYMNNYQPSMPLRLRAKEIQVPVQRYIRMHVVLQSIWARGLIMISSNQFNNNNNINPNNSPPPHD